MARAFTAQSSDGKSRSTVSRWTAKLAVELDGKQHEWFSDYDAGRTEILERLGLHIVRFTNDEVSNDLESVLAKIHAELRLPFD